MPTTTPDHLALVPRRDPFAPTFNEAELATRRSRLNCSELPVVLGLSRYQTPLALWLEKHNELPPKPDTDAMLLGRLLEPVLLDLYEHRTASVLVPHPEPRVCDHWGTLWGSADALVVKRGSGPACSLAEAEAAGLPGVEAKNRGGVRERARWGEPGSDAVPDEILVQCVGYMCTYNRPSWDVVTLFAGNEPAIFRLHRDTALEAEILERAATWWHLHIEQGATPDLDGSDAAQRWLAQKFRDAGELVRDATVEEDDWLAQLRYTRAAREELEAREAAFIAQLKLAIGNDRGLKGPSGRVVWSPTKGRSSTAWEALVADLVRTGRMTEAECRALVAAHTHTAPPSRQFRPTFPPSTGGMDT